MNPNHTFFKLVTAVTAIAAVLILPNFDGVGAQALRPLSVETKVRNVSRGENIFQDQTRAQSGDRVHIQVRVEALAPQTSVVLRSPLPARLVFAGGESGLNNAGGMALGNMSSGDNRTLTYEATITGNTETTLLLSAFANSLETSEVSDSANITVTTAASVTTVEFQNMILRNRVMNLTRGETEFKDVTRASAGDRLRFEVYIQNQTTVTQSGLSLRYYIPFGRFVFASGNPDLILNGLQVEELRQGASKTQTFEVTLIDGSGDVLVSTARIFSGAVPQKEASATVLIGVAAGTTTPPPAVAGANTLNGQKTITAVNRSLGQDATKVSARPGDVIAFQLTYRNTSAAVESARIEADIRDIMTLARVSHTDGAVVDNGIIRFPAVNVSAGSEISQTFEITVLDSAHVATIQDRNMGIIFGNPLLIQVGTCQVAGTSTIKPPRTGASENLVVLLALFATAGFWAISKRRKSRLELV